MKVADSKREEFRKYLEKAGVLDALTKGVNRRFTALLSLCNVRISYFAFYSSCVSL